MTALARGRQCSSIASTPPTEPRAQLWMCQHGRHHQSMADGRRSNPTPPLERGPWIPSLGLTSLDPNLETTGRRCAPSPVLNTAGVPLTLDASLCSGGHSKVTAAALLFHVLGTQSAPEAELGAGPQPHLCDQQTMSGAAGCRHPEPDTGGSLCCEGPGEDVEGSY